MEIYENKSSTIEGERWADIQGYEGIYQASNLGRIRSLDRLISYINGANRTTKGSILFQKVCNSGYLTVGLWLNNKEKRCMVHRLIATCFVTGDKSLTVNHKDGNKLNNNIKNLEWLTQSENSKHSYSKLGRVAYVKGRTGKDSPVAIAVKKLSISGEVLAIYESITEAAIKNNCSASWISATVRGKANTCGGFKWQIA